MKYVLTDYITSAIALFIFNIYRYYVLDLKVFGIPAVEYYIFGRQMIAEVIFLPFAMLGIYWLSGYYNHPFNKSRLQEMMTTLASSLLNTLLFYFLFLTNDMDKVLSKNLYVLLGLFILIFIFPYMGRYFLTSCSIRKIRRKKLSFRTLIVGNSAKAHATADMLRNSVALMGYDVLGFVDIPGEEKYDNSGISFIDIEKKVIELNISQIIISPEGFNDTRILDLLSRLYTLPVDVKITPATFSYITYGIHLNDIYGEPLVELTSPRISESTKNVKRTLDVLISGIALILLSPLYLATALCVKMSSPGPVIYSQERAGLRRKPFRIYKFRTMRQDAEKNGPALSTAKDPRITKTGSILRKYRLDEIPQFWNVFKGDMSLVGPRPEREYFIREIVKEAPYYNMIHQVRPGITSWGMVKFGYASNIQDMVRRAQFDLVYLQNMSILVDFKIIIYTIKTVLSGVGV